MTVSVPEKVAFFSVCNEIFPLRPHVPFLAQLKWVTSLELSAESGMCHILPTCFYAIKNNPSKLFSSTTYTWTCKYTLFMIIHVHEIVKMSCLSCHGSEQFLMWCRCVEHVVTICLERVSVEGKWLECMSAVGNAKFSPSTTSQWAAASSFLSHYRIRNLKTVCAICGMCGSRGF